VVQIGSTTFTVLVDGHFVAERPFAAGWHGDQFTYVALSSYFNYRVWFDDTSITGVGDTAGPYPPHDLHITEAEDTGQSATDGITYMGDPLFVWSQPPDSGTCGTANAYQFAVTGRGLNPWDGPKLRDGFVADSSARPGTLPDGSYTFWVQAKDNCEHWGQWVPLDYQIDTTAPGLPHDLTNPEGPVTPDPTPSVYWACEDDSVGSGIWTYDIRFTGPGGSPSHAYQSGDAVLDDVDYGGVPLETGPWDWSVRAVDVAGNVTDWSASAALTVAAGPRWVHIELEERYQLIDGFGGAFAMWGCEPDDEALALVTDSLGLSIVRVEADAELGECTNTLETVMRACSHGVDKVTLSVWCPPSEYLHDAACGCGTGACVRSWNSDHSPEWADSLARLTVHRYLEPLRQVRPDISVYLSLQNEPNLDSLWAYWSPTQIQDFVPMLRERLDHYGGADVRILAPECSQAEVTFERDWTPGAFGDLAQAVAGNVTGFSYHIYDNSIAGPGDVQFEALRLRLGHFRSLLPASNQVSWQTETSGAHRIPSQNPERFYPTVGWHENMDEDDKALAAAQYLHLSMTAAQSSAFLWWGLTWKSVSGDANNSDEGLVLVDNSHRPMPMVADGITKKYYAFKHFSKYVRPGFRRVFAWSDDPVLASAYVSEAGDKLVVVLINPYAAPWQVLLDPLPGYTLIETRTTLPGATTGFERSDWAGEMPGRSIATLVFGQESSDAGQSPRLAQGQRLAISVGPNPGRGGAEIAFELDAARMTNVSIFDASGRRVRELSHTQMLAGKHKILWDGRNDAGQPVGSAVYFVRLTHGGRVRISRLVAIN
jgi:O-glycosyl hydrolase